MGGQIKLQGWALTVPKGGSQSGWERGSACTAVPRALHAGSALGVGPDPPNIPM